MMDFPSTSAYPDYLIEQRNKVAFMRSLGLIPKAVSDQLMKEKELNKNNVQTRSKRKSRSTMAFDVEQMCSEQVKKSSTKEPQPLTTNETSEGTLNFTTENIMKNIRKQDLIPQVASCSRDNNNVMMLRQEQNNETTVPSNQTVKKRSIMKQLRVEDSHEAKIKEISKQIENICLLFNECKRTLASLNNKKKAPISNVNRTSKNTSENKTQKQHQEDNISSPKLAKVAPSYEVLFNKKEFQAKSTRKGNTETEKELAHNTTMSPQTVPNSVIKENEHMAIMVNKSSMKDDQLRKTQTKVEIWQVAGPSKVQPTNNNTLEEHSPVLKELQNLDSIKESFAENPALNATQEGILTDEEKENSTQNHPDFGIATPEPREAVVDQQLNTERVGDLHTEIDLLIENQHVEDDTVIQKTEMKSFEDFKTEVSKEEVAIEMTKYNPRMARQFHGVAQTDARIRNNIASRMCRAKARIAKRKMIAYYKSMNLE